MVGWGASGWGWEMEWVWGGRVWEGGGNRLDSAMGGVTRQRLSGRRETAAGMLVGCELKAMAEKGNLGAAGRAGNENALGWELLAHNPARCGWRGVENGGKQQRPASPFGRVGVFT